VSDGELDGLVHIILALTEGRTNDVSDVVSIGDKVKVRVREVVCSAAGRILLSMLAKEKEEKSYPAPRERNMVRVAVIRVGGIIMQSRGRDRELEEYGCGRFKGVDGFVQGGTSCL